MDDQAIGGGGGSNMGPTSAQSADNSGPLNDRLVSKNWSVRAAAFDELKGLCAASKPKSKDAIFNDHCNLWKTYLKDSNPGALEKALCAMAAWVDKIHKDILTACQNELITILVEKCIGHAKIPVVMKSIEPLLLIFEVGENFEESTETLTELLKHKNVKVSITNNQYYKQLKLI
jgi:hypothetical protein